MPMIRILATSGLLFAGALVVQAQPNAASSDFFESKIRPVLANNCYACHTASQLGDLRLDSRDAMLKGGKHGAAIVPGDPDTSLLITAVRQTGELKMPMGAKLKPAEIDDLVAWVKAGATWPQAATATATAAAAPAPAAGAKYTIAPERRAFWSLQPLTDPKAPAVK